MKWFRRFWLVLVSAVAVTPAALPARALACAACFGKSDSSLAQGMNWGILTLLGIVLSVLTCFVVFFVQVARRAAPEDNEANPPKPSV
ncbi:MAG TPA: hypothetical protein VMB80_03425 [Candidatus Acidoferrum sp.]|nr:hypothetical protein [Candidatus Acidoferrum sp.]